VPSPRTKTSISRLRPPTSAFSDTAGETNTLNGVRITTLPSGGTLYIGNINNPVNVGDIVPLSALGSTFKFHSEYERQRLAGWHLLLPGQDTGGTGTITAGPYSSTGVDLDPSPKTMQIVVNSVNDAPTATGSTVTVASSGAIATHTFTINDFGFADAADLPQCQSAAERHHWHHAAGERHVHVSRQSGHCEPGDPGPEHRSAPIHGQHRWSDHLHFQDSGRRRHGRHGLPPTLAPRPP